MMEQNALNLAMQGAIDAGDFESAYKIEQQLKNTKPAGGVDPRMTAPFAPLIGLHQGAQDVVMGGIQGLAQLGGDDALEGRVNELAAAGEQGFRQATQGAETTANLSRFAGNMAAMPFPGAKAFTMPGRIADATLKGGAAGFLMPNENPEDRILSTAFGAAGGTVLEGALGYGANKMANARAGNIGVDADARAAMEFAKQNNLPISGDDLSKNPLPRWAGSFIDNMPVIGRGGYRKIQGEAAEKAAQDFIGEFGVNLPSDDAAKVVKDSATRVLNEVKKEKRRLYNEAFAVLDTGGEQAFTASRNKAAELLEKEVARGSQADQGVIQELQKFIEAPQGPMSFWHSVRSDLGSTIRGGSTGENLVIKDRGQAVLSELKATLDKEFGDTANSISPQARAAWRKADDYYRDQIVPYKKTAIARAIASDDYEAVLNLVAGRGSGKGTDSASMANRVYTALDDQGRDGVVFAMLNKAFDAATTDGKPFHPAIFAKNLEAMEKRLGVFLKGKQKAYADGLQKYMRHIEAAGQYAHNPPTGRQLYGAVMLGGAAAAPGTMAQVALGTQGLRLLFNTERGKSLMLAMSRVTPESERASTLAAEINSLLYRANAANQRSRSDTQQ